MERPVIRGLKIEEVKIGGGMVAARGSRVSVRYDGLLNRGEKFQENFDATFTIGKREVIAGLENGVEGMRVGGVRKVWMGPHLAYGASGVPGKIPPGAKLLFVVELLEVQENSGERPAIRR
jgi:FKBP-type peptidyl-prolyl cis-trans isomerase